ncbi:beta-galactosidase [Ottowia testudinis]|uniref:Beta-galactosidase n=1 Tax=Ottowia testudinis TaxID=2816950 RepID=A0A975CHU7_9BURK|nr:beta-galactosidase [Ottowia testudinis]QTD45864.1 beta-galactosidase [Ottowia testudinis]
MKTIFALVCWILLSTTAWAKSSLVSTITLMPWDFAGPEVVETELTKAGFNHVTLYISWTDVEPEPGQFRFEKFDAMIDRLKTSGLSVILLLDFGGRKYFNDDGSKSGKTVLPAWYINQHPNTLMRDFSGNITFQINLFDAAARKLVDRFIDNSVRHLSQRHGQSILGFAIGLQEEHEIKFGQEGYRWRDYSEKSKAAFQSRHGQPLPVLNYNNEIGQVRPHPEPMLTAHRLFREAQLRDATCHYADVIRQHRQQVVGYFGETLTSHDAIYATGIVEELADCIDIAVIDFNFYDGYSLQPSPYTLPLLASYLASSGYGKILVGAYAEKWMQAGKAAALLPYIRKTIETSLKNPAVIGFEIGGLQKPISETRSAGVDFSALQRLRINATRAPILAKRHKIGIFASKSNFYFWHGERSHNRNIHQDALIQAYALLSEHPDIDAAVIGERNLRDVAQLLRSFQAILVPHQAALPESVKQQLKAYWAAGGILIQDLRLGEFRDDGYPTNDWLHEVFGIQSVQWQRQAGTFVYQAQLIELDLGGRAYANHAVLEARPGFQLMANAMAPWPGGRLDRLRRRVFGNPPAVAAPNQGLILRGKRSLVFGCLPQLAEGASAPMWRQIFTQEILALLAPR